MRQQRMLFVLLGLAVGMLGSAARAQERSPAEVRLQAALHAEEVEGNLARAIELYRQIVSRYAGERDVAARALFYMGRSYEKQGSQEATRAYQRVVREYGDQSQVAAQARARLAALQAPVPVAGRGPVARRVLTDEDAPLESIAMMTPSPDGRRVAYFDVREGRERRLVVRDLASGAEERLVPAEPAAWSWATVWSPDGTRLAFVERSGGAGVLSIKIFDLASRTVTAVQGAEVSASGGEALWLQDWSRDGRFLRYWHGSPRGGTGEVGIVPVGGGARRVLAEGVSWGGRLSPDGRYVAQTVGERGSEQVVVQEVGGGPRRQVISEPGGNRLPEWSPDGSAIAYLRRDGIWLVRMADGVASGAPRLAYATETANTFRGPAWTASGGLHVLLSFDEYIPQRIGVDLATGAVSAAVEQLPRYALPGGGFWGAFKWSPDQQHTAFGTAVGDIVISGANGTAVASHTVAPYEPLFVEGWSGDGREVFFTRYGGTRATAALDVASGRVREIGRWTYPAVVRSVSADGSRILLYYHGQDLPVATPRGLVVVEPGQPGGTLVAPEWDADSLRLQWVERVSAQGDRVAFARSARRGSSDGQSLWIVGSDGTGLRRLATVKEIGHVLWDPSGRFVAYAGRPDSTTVVLRILDVATGAEWGSTRLPSQLWGRFLLCDWSRDGRFIGLVAREPRMEYWVVQGLLDGRR